MNRADKIKAGKLWQVHTHESIKPEKVFFEGSRRECLIWLRKNRLYRDYRHGVSVRLGQIIWEDK
jgi:hypothetical protein